MQSPGALVADGRPTSRFCSLCGGRLRQPDAAVRSWPICEECGAAHYDGPTVVVLAVVFAEERMLLMRRGLPPYAGMWAPPGGFAEAGESLEAAAVRELDEEVGVRIDRAQMIPHAMLSLPAMNQVCLCFISMLERVVPLTPRPPEALEARWFLEHEYPQSEMWSPAANFDIARLYDRVRTRRFDFYQRTDDAFRIISDGTQITYLWRGS
jgi:ADP-ribose pyrophosphatase YjhB (NUDIX family)